MPINSPTGFLDITNATLRTSNLEAENLLITGGNIYVTSELEADATVLNLENVTRKGNVSSNTIEITNATTGIVATGNVHALKFIGSGSHLTGIPPTAITGTLSQWSDGANSDVYIASNVGIGNVHTLTSNTLQVGGNLYVRDTDANVLTVNGNVVASYFEGDGSKLSGIVTDLQGVTDNGNVTTNVVQFSNVTTGLVTTANIEVGGDIKVVGLTAGTVPYTASDKFLKDSFITMTGDATVITSNLDVTGNIFMRGEKFIVESETKLINDAIIGIANNNTVSTTDKGIIMQNTTGNVAIIHHGTGDGFADQLTFGYTADPLDTVTVTNDLTKELTVNVLGNVITQNNLSVGGTLSINTISAASSHSLQAVTNLGNVTSNTVQFSNAITSLVASSNIVATGNVTAGYDTNTTSYFGKVAVGNDGRFAHISQNAPATYALKQTATGLTSINTPGPSGHIRFTVNDGDVGAEKMRITGAGNVGIGVSAPQANLHVVGNVYVSSNLTVSGNVADLNVVSNVNMLHTANTAAIKLNSNVVTEFPRSKKLIKYPRVAMTGASAPTGYVASASSNWPSASSDPWQAFDNIWDPDGSGTNSWESHSSSFATGTTYQGPRSSTGLNTFDGNNGEYLNIKLPEKIVLQRYEHTTRANRWWEGPYSGFLYGSNDGFTNYDKIHTFSAIDLGRGDDSEASYIHTVNTTTAYNEYRFHVTQTQASVYVSICLFNLFGIPEYDPEAHGTDVTVKSVTNVPNTDWLEVYYDAKSYSTLPASVNDESGSTNTFNGTIPSGHQITFDDGDIKAFVFPGRDSTTPLQYPDYIQTTLSGWSDNQPHTQSCWFKPTSITPFDQVFGLWDVASTSYEMSAFGIYTDKFSYYHFGSEFQYPYDVSSLIGTWCHISVIHTGYIPHTKVYLNGDLLSGSRTAGSGNTLSLGTAPKLALGKDPGRNNAGQEFAFHGSIANYRLFNRALAQDEIYQLYAYQKEDFGHSTNTMTLKAGRLGIGTSEPRVALDVRGEIRAVGSMLYLLDTPLTHEWHWSGSTSSSSQVGSDHRIHYNQFPPNCRAIYADVFLPMASAGDHGTHILGEKWLNIGRTWTAGRSNTTATTNDARPSTYMTTGVTQGAKVVYIGQPSQSDNFEYYYGNWWQSLIIPLADGNNLYHGRAGYGGGAHGWIYIYTKGYYV